MNWGTPFEIYIRVPRERLSHSPGNAEGQSLVVSPDFRQHAISVPLTITRTSERFRSVENKTENKVEKNEKEKDFV